MRNSEEDFKEKEKNIFVILKKIEDQQIKILSEFSELNKKFENVLEDFLGKITSVENDCKSHNTIGEHG